MECSGLENTVTVVSAPPLCQALCSAGEQTATRSGPGSLAGTVPSALQRSQLPIPDQETEAHIHEW